MAVVRGLGAGLDLGEAVLTLAKKKRAAATIGFLSAIVDTYVGIKETEEALEKGDDGAAVGSIITTAGSATAAVGWGGLIVLAEGGPILVTIGFFLVGVGVMIKLLFSESDYEIFVEHCAWGPKYGHGGKVDSSRVEMSEWKENYDEQLYALLQLICKFELSPIDKRSAELRMGFVPEGSTLKLHYLETWRGNAANSRDFRVAAKLQDGKDPVLTGDDGLAMSARARTATPCTLSPER